MAADFFIPWEKRDLDGMDKDLGTSAFVLLEPAAFATGRAARLCCVAGKTGKLYVLDADDLGGYQMGAGRRDAALQVAQLGGAVFASVGSYPHEGGWLYATPVGGPTVALRFGGRDAGGGGPVFTAVGRTTETAAGRQGVGHDAVTSLGGAAGTGIVWIVDVEGLTLRAYGAVPDAQGMLPTYALLDNAGQSKFSRPAFGNKRVYVTTSTGFVTAFGSPMRLPLDCSGPADAGTVAVPGGGSATVGIECRARTPLRVDAVGMDSAEHFAVNGFVSALPPCCRWAACSRSM